MRGNHLLSKNMRIFMIWPDFSPEIISLISGLKSGGHEIIYWLALKCHEGKFSDIILHDHWDAWVGIPPEKLKDVEFDPPGEELINKMHRVESIILTMMNKHFEGKCVDERKNFYYNMLQYWYGVLNKFKFEVIIYWQPPHHAYNYLIFELARILKIKTIIFSNTLIAGRILWENNIWEGSRALLEEIAANKDKKFSPKDLSEDLQLYLKFCFNDATTVHHKTIMKRGSLKNKIILKIKILVKSIKNFTVLKRLYQYLYKVLGNNIQKEYHYYSKVQPDLTKKYIYVALNSQPECSTSPLGGIFVNQILMVKTLASAIPKDWLIYVKEHWVQWLLFGLNYTDYRYPGYYKQIFQIKNVKLIPINSDSYSLIEKSQAVATVSGTSGWEAVLRKKPALIFGYPWYKDSPGIFMVNDSKSCRLAIKKIINGYRPHYDEIINYLKCIEHASVHGYIDEKAQKNLKITKQNCINNILTIINQELKNT